MNAGIITLIVVGAVVLLIACCCLTCCLSNSSWIKRKREVWDANSKITETACGAIEYSMRGAAPYILLLHGAPGAHDGASNFAARWVEGGFGVIAPSRPGYGRTPHDSGKSYAAQADCFAALLDVLQIDKVIPYGVSAGGPAAIHFAARHPDKTAALLLEAAVTGPMTHPIEQHLDSGAVKIQFTSPTFARIQMWMLREHPAFAMKNMLAEESTYTPQETEEAAREIVNDPKRMAILEKLSEISIVGALYPNSLDTLKVELQNCKERPPLEEVKAPTFIAHGDRDGDINISHAENANSLIQGSELYKVEGGTHLLFLHAKGEELVNAQMEFARKHS